MDEVGRGALAGPVTVGAVAVRETTPTGPRGLHDSKLLTSQARERLDPRVRRWALAWGVGHATNDEIDAWGILAALRLAGHRALAQVLAGLGPDGRVDHVVLDGGYDWLRRPRLPPDPQVHGVALPGSVHLVIKGDQRCAAVAGASVIAKVARDRLMVDLASGEGRFGWAENKGYAAPEHRAALLEHGPSGWHRRTWNLLGAGHEAADVLAGQDVLVTDADLVSP
jgi:ribonuclease HII